MSLSDTTCRTTKPLRLFENFPTGAACNCGFSRTVLACGGSPIDLAESSASCLWASIPRSPFQMLGNSVPAVWLTCVSPFCNHSRAIPLAPWRIRWGVHDVAGLMRRHFRCGVCGRKGCTFGRPEGGFPRANGVTFWDPEYFPAGKELHMAGPKVKFESYNERDARVLAAYLARYPCGDAIKTVDRICKPLFTHEKPAGDPRSCEGDP